MTRPQSWILNWALVIHTAISASFAYRSLVKAMGMEELLFTLIAAAAVVSACLFVLRPRISTSLALTLLAAFLGWAFFRLIHGLGTIRPTPVSLIGWVGTTGFALVWGATFLSMNQTQRRIFTGKFARAQYILGIGVGCLAIYQYLFDQSLFGLNTHVHYGDLLAVYSGAITRRATSLIGSPQVLGAYMFLLLWPTLFSRLNGTAKLMLVALYGIAGLFSGSAAFLGSVLLATVTFLAVRNFRGKGTSRIKLIAASGLLVAVSMFASTRLMTIDSAIASALKPGLVGHLPFYLTMLGMEYDAVLSSAGVVGHGLGTTDRLVEVVYEGDVPDVWKPGNESYILQIWYELGAIGVLALLGFLLSVFLLLVRLRTRLGAVYAALLAGIVGNMMLTPAYTGLNLSYFLWFLLAAPVFLSPRELERLSAS